MKVLVATECHFKKGPDGFVYSADGTRGFSFWERYLDVFDSVTVLGRVSPGLCEAGSTVEGPEVSFAELPGYTGPYQFAAHIKIIIKKIKSEVIKNGGISYIARSPGVIGVLVVDEAIKKEIHFGIEVVGDPYDVFAPGVVNHMLRPIFRTYFSKKLKKHCYNSIAVSYVTEKYLQNRYPCPNYSFNISSVDLPEEAFCDFPKTASKSKSNFILIFIGSLNQLYKGQDILLNAFSLCIKKGLDLKLVFVGDGRFRTYLTDMAYSLQLRERVIFKGVIPSGEKVRELLDQADLFVLPSKTEGLPRAVLEAMARGLPCVCTSVGGVPEVLSREDLVPPGDAVALAKKINDVLTNPERMAYMSIRNMKKAKEYREDILRGKRNDFYSVLKEYSGKE